MHEFGKSDRERDREKKFMNGKYLRDADEGEAAVSDDGEQRQIYLGNARVVQCRQ